MRRKYKESNTPDHLALQVRYHKGKKWVTVAKLYVRATGELASWGQSICSPRDNPNRKIGRAIAVGRALKRYHGGGRLDGA